MVDESSAKITGIRLAHIKTNFNLSEGYTVNCSLLNGRRGIAKVIKLSENSISFKLDLFAEPLSKDNNFCIVAIPRPQAIKRIIQYATLTGIKELHFVKSEYTDKSYLGSRELRYEKYIVEVYKAMEQAFDSMPLSITVHSSLSDIIKKLESDEHNIKFLSHINDPIDNSTEDFQPVSLSTFCNTLNPEHKIYFAVGPEKGWSPKEIESFKENRFIPISLGNRVLRVDVAVMYLGSQLGLLRKAER